MAKVDFTKALRLKVGRSVAHEVKTTYFTAHSYLRALFKKQDTDSDTFLLNNSLALRAGPDLATFRRIGAPLATCTAFPGNVGPRPRIL